MGDFSSAFYREMGRNTAKVVSNVLFGDMHSTPHRIAGNAGSINQASKHIKIEEVEFRYNLSENVVNPLLFKLSNSHIFNFFITVFAFFVGLVPVLNIWVWYKIGLHFHSLYRGIVGDWMLGYRRFKDDKRFKSGLKDLGTDSEYSTFLRKPVILIKDDRRSPRFWAYVLIVLLSLMYIASFGASVTGKGDPLFTILLVSAVPVGLLLARMKMKKIKGHFISSDINSIDFELAKRFDIDKEEIEYLEEVIWSRRSGRWRKLM